MEPWNLLDQLDSVAISERLRSEECPHQTVGKEHPTLSYDKPYRAAVLIPMFRHLNAWHLLFIRRAEHEGDRHSGQVAFPGGRWTPQDADVTDTALREAQEEIGLDPKRVVLLGKLRPLHTLSNFLVTPVVGKIPWPLKLTTDPVEVARVFSIPLGWLGDPANRQVRTWPSPDHPEARGVVFFEEFDRELLWGVSARITVDFLAVLGGS
jgi:8-oxo-dGTP pyrophosphatase MutT (NUDIX family)